MQNDLIDRLLTWISKLQETLKVEKDINDVALGEYVALLNVKAFILTDGALSQTIDLEDFTRKIKS